MAAETQYTANTGIGVVSVANALLDGTGTLATVLTAAANGTLIKTVTIKAQVTTTQGMVRLFVFDGVATTKLIAEIEIPAITKSATVPAFETTITLNLTLKAGWVLKASTEKAETFNVIAEGQNWAYYATSVRSDTTKNINYNAATTISTANSGLDGTGTMGTALIAAAGNGSNIQSVTIKARVSTTAGMVRLFLFDGVSATRLLTEVPVPAITKSATVPAFEHIVRFNNSFALKVGWQLRASTEKAETFSVVAESFDWQYPA